MTKKYKIVSLFSGCGGLDLGFHGGFSFMGNQYHRNPIEIVFANDFDCDASTCYNSNSILTEQTRCVCKDIRSVESKDIPDFDIMLAGFPCQPFSNAGNRKGINDDNGRGTLFEECQRIIEAKIKEGKAPIAFVFENVRGILSSKMPDGTTVPNEIIKRMKVLGYEVNYQLVCASDYGVPQRRYRVLIVGILQGHGVFDFEEMRKIVEKNKIPSEKYGGKESLLLGSILKDVDTLPDNEVWEYSATTQRMVDLIGSCALGMEGLKYFQGDFKDYDLPDELREGRSWKDIPYDKLSDRFRRIYDDPKKYHAPKFFRRFAFGEINGTITASAQPENCGITHPILNRRYSVREIARIQSFPDDYRFNAIPLQGRYKVIGNAVPPIMAWCLANALFNCIKK